LCKVRDSLGKFNSIEEFAHHLPQEASNKRQLESLIQAGVFDNLHSNRNQLLSSIDTILGTSNLVRKENNSQQVSLFAGSDIEPEYAAIRFTDCPEWSQPEKIAREFEVLGLYLSAHPLDQYEYQLKKMNIKPSNSLYNLDGKGTGQRITMVGQLTSVQERVSQKGNRFAFLQFTDKTGGFEVTCFSDLLISNRNSLQPGNILIIYVEAKIENGLVRLLAQRIMPLEDKIALAHSGLGIWLENADCLEDIKLILSEDGEGKAPVVINIIDTASQIKMILPNFFQLSGNCRKKLKSVPGIIKIEDILENA
jgi:DNA polymerase-3 subunit alpha